MDLIQCWTVIATDSERGENANTLKNLHVQKNLARFEKDWIQMFLGALCQDSTNYSDLFKTWLPGGRACFPYKCVK